MTYKVIRVTSGGEREVAFIGDEPLLGLTEEAAKLLAVQAEGEEEEGATFEVVKESNAAPVEVEAVEV